MTKNVFEQLAKNISKHISDQKCNIRWSMHFNKIRNDLEEIIGMKLKNNKSYFSLLIDGCEIFLGEVNYDISSIPMGKFYEFERRFTWLLTEQLREFVNTADKELVIKFQEHVKDGEYRLRYIVKDDTEGTCLSFKCELEWRCDSPLFALRDYYCGYECFSPKWLLYWYDRERYFANY